MGFGGAAYGLGAALGVLTLAWIAQKTKLREKNFVTMAEEAQFHYNGNRLVKNVMSIMMYIIEVVWLGNHVNGGATYLSYVTGVDLVTAKAIAVLAFGVYVIIGGYLAVVWTDLIQLTILVAGFIAITAVCLPMAGGWTGITEAVTAAGLEGNLTFYGVGTMGVMALISLIWSIFIPCWGTPTYRMRVYTAKSNKTATNALKMSGLLLLVFCFRQSSAWLLLRLRQTTMLHRFWNIRISLSPILQRLHWAPFWDCCFMISGLSATMSSGDSDAIAGVTIAIQDIYPIFTGKSLPEEKVGKWSRIMTVVTLLLAFCATLFAQDVISYISNVIGSIIPGVSIAMVLGALWKRAELGRAVWPA